MRLSDLTPLELLGLHAEVGQELRSRGVVRSSNQPAGDYAEYLFCKAFGWAQSAPSIKSFDAMDEASGNKYQIKSRRLTQRNSSRQVSQLRGLDADCFDFLARLLFDEKYRVFKAAIIPHSNVMKSAKYVEHTNSWRYLLRDNVWEEASVIDVTEKLKAAQV